MYCTKKLKLKNKLVSDECQNLLRLSLYRLLKFKLSLLSHENRQVASQRANIITFSDIWLHI